MWFVSLKDLKLLFYYLRMDHIFCTCNLDMYVFCCQFGEMLNAFRVDDPRSEPHVPHEMTLKKMAADVESDIAIRFVDEND